MSSPRAVPATGVHQELSRGAHQGSPTGHVCRPQGDCRSAEISDAVLGGVPVCIYIIILHLKPFLLYSRLPVPRVAPRNQPRPRTLPV